MTAETAPMAPAVSVLSLRVRGPAGDAAQQAGGRERLLAAARKALLGWDPGRRVALEAPDGLAFVGHVPPSIALRAASIVAREAGEGTLGIGLHHGPVQVVQEGQDPQLRGEGLDMARALAAFTGTRAVVASQAFRDALAAGAPREAEDLRPSGEIVDGLLGKHPIFLFDAGAARSRSGRRTLMAAGGLVLLLGGGWAARTVRQQREAARRPGILLLDIKPSGEVFVGGQSLGATPPLQQLQLPPGRHAIEVRSGRFPPLRLEVQLQPGEEMQLRHVFAAPAPRRVRPKEKEKDPTLMEQLKERWKTLW